MARIWLLALALATMSCGGSNTCSKACKKAALCFGGEAGVPGSFTCPFSAACTPVEECQAECLNKASCDALTGKDPQGALSYKSCLGACASVAPDTGPPPDGGPPDGSDSYVTPDSYVSPDLYVLPDYQPPDQYVPPPDTGPTSCSLSVVGKPCTASGGECGNYHTCLLTSTSAGFCTCACTMDNPQTSTNEDTCPGASSGALACGAVELSSGGYQPFCLQTCAPQIGANPCNANGHCLPQSGAYVGLPDLAVCLFQGCASNADCPVTTGVPCVTTGAGCPSGQTCAALASTGTAGICVTDGICDVASGICNGHTQSSATAKVGDPCTGDVQCGSKMRCLIEFDELTFLSGPGGACSTDADCCTGGTCSGGTCSGGTCVTWRRNGYCAISNCQFPSLPAFACPAGSSCNTLYVGGMCQQDCTLTDAGSCRGFTGDQYGDYECRAWDGPGFAPGPVCDFGNTQTCADMQDLGLTCDQLGTTANPTNMQCRNLQGVPRTNTAAADGFCLDDTSSGPLP